MGLFILDAIVWMLGICCQIPLLDEVRPSPHQSAGSSGLSWLWTSFAAAVVFLSLSLAMSIWLALRLL